MCGGSIAQDNAFNLLSKWRKGGGGRRWDASQGESPAFRSGPAIRRGRLYQQNLPVADEMNKFPEIRLYTFSIDSIGGMQAPRVYFLRDSDLNSESAPVGDLTRYCFKELDWRDNANVLERIEGWQVAISIWITATHQLAWIGC